MLRRARALWRAARGVPVIRGALRTGDRVWWARVIRRADVVDVAFVAAQGGPRSARAAVRAYVRGGFRRGLSLNPLLMEQLVSSQLSDVGRVPAMYAYLVNDPRTLRTSVNWDAAAYAAAFPECLTSPGGPVGHAWRTAAARGTIDLGAGPASTAVASATVRATALAAAASARRRTSTAPVGHGSAAVRFVCRIDADEPDLAAALEAAADVTTRLSCDTIVAVSGASTDAWVNAALLALRMPGVWVTGNRDGLVTELERDAPSGTVLLVRGPGAQIGADDLVALAHAASTGPVEPLWLAPDGTVAAAGFVTRGAKRYPLLRGHPAEDARALGPEIASVGIAGGTYAHPAGESGRPGRTLTTTTVRAAGTPRATAGPTRAADDDLDALLAPLNLAVARWDASGPVLRRTPGNVVLPDGRSVPRLRWAIRTAAPAGPAGEWWGDTHFARGIAEALRRLGQDVVIDSYAARTRPSVHLDDVVLALRGPEPLAAQPAARSILWVISHPDQVEATELAGFDAVFAASELWAAAATARFGRTIVPLLQCTDPHRFHPAGRPRTDGLVFVGTARGIPRPSIIEPIRAGIPVAVYGPDWTGWIPAPSIVARGVPNSELPRLYEQAAAVLNDHWPAMQAAGFVSNRLYDVVAAGGRVVSDAVDGIHEIFGGAVRTYRTIPELIAMLSGDVDALFPPPSELAAISARVRSAHSFDARARTLLDTALAH